MILRQLLKDVCEAGDFSAMETLTWPDVVIHSLLAGGGEMTFDRVSYRKLLQPVLEGLSDLHVAMEDTLCDGNLLAVRCVLTGFYDDEKAGLGAQRKPIYFTGMMMVRLRDGLIEESWNYFDFETMYLQME